MTATQSPLSPFEQTRAFVQSAAQVFADYDEQERIARLNAESRLVALGLETLGLSVVLPELSAMPAPAIPALIANPPVSGESVKTPVALQSGLKRNTPDEKPRTGLKHKCPGEGCPRDCFGAMCRSCAQKAGTYGNSRAARNAQKAEEGRPVTPVGTKAKAEASKVPVIAVEPVALSLKQLSKDLPAVRSKGMTMRAAHDQGWFIVAFVVDGIYDTMQPLTVSELPETARYVETCHRQGQDWYSGELKIGRSQIRDTAKTAESGAAR